MWCVMTESKIKQSESEVKKATEYNYLLIRGKKNNKKKNKLRRWQRDCRELLLQNLNSKRFRDFLISKKRTRSRRHRHTHLESLCVRRRFKLATATTATGELTRAWDWVVLLLDLGQIQSQKSSKPRLGNVQKNHSQPMKWGGNEGTANNLQ